MTRIAGFILLAVVCLNIGAVMVADAGTADNWDMDVNTGVSDRIDDALDNLRDDDGNLTEWNPFSAGGVSAIFNIFIFAVDASFAFLNLVVAFPLLLSNLGAPGWMTAPLYPLAFLSVADAVIYIASGRRLIPV
ncbi:MAG: hypothetical protein ACOCR0_01220 [Haloferacaceae archaeon]